MPKSPEDNYEPRVAVDSGTILIVDPCYLETLLELTPEQSEKWHERCQAIVDRGDREMTGMFVSGRATCVLLSTPDGDGIFDPNQVAKFLLDANDAEEKAEKAFQEAQKAKKATRRPRVTARPIYSAQENKKPS
jgi:hypothetical protein